MKVLFSKKTIIVLIIAFAIAAVAVISSNTKGDSGFITGGANTLMKPLKSTAAYIVRTFESIYGIMYRYEKIVAENESLKLQIAEMRQDYLEYTEMAEENARLKNFLGFTARFEDRVYDHAVIIASNASNWSSSFTISKGTLNSDVEVGDAVVTESGILIGRVTAVYATTSTAAGIIDTTSAAAVNVGEGRYDATAKGDFSLMRRGLLKLERFPDDAPVLPGDAVITSGKGGVYPKGLTIGEVSEVFENPTGIGRYAAIAPSLDIESISHVFIITDFDIMD